MAVECRSSGSRLSHSLLLSSSLLCISRTRERADTKLWSLQRREKPDKSGFVNLFILIQRNLPHQQPAGSYLFAEIHTYEQSNISAWLRSWQLIYQSICLGCR